MKQYIVDAFADELFTGNPAAVLICEKMPPKELMLKIAKENNYSETAFAVRKGQGEYDLKWFTPGGEIDLCGHATLGTAFIIDKFVEKGAERIVFHTLSGELTVVKEEKGYTMAFPSGKVKPVSLSERVITASSGLAREAYYDGGDMVVIIENEKDLETFVPDSELISAVEGVGFILTAKSEHYDFVSRCFYPKLGVPEDPVTGRAHTFLSPIWSEKLNKKTMSAKQHSERGGELTVRQEDEKVFITGNVQLFMVGDIPFDL